MANIIFLIVSMFCESVFIGVGIYALFKKGPMHFISGSSEKIEKETFTNVKEFNRKNGIMWIMFGLGFIIVSILYFFISEVIFMLIYIAYMIIGFIGMLMYYTHLHDQYTK